MLWTDTSPAHSGFVTPGPDRLMRRVYPVLFGWIADYPEKVLLSGVVYGRCGRCKVQAGNLGSLLEPASPNRLTPEELAFFPPFPQRRMADSQEVLISAEDQVSAKARRDLLRAEGLQDVENFCWDWELSDIHDAWLPDELHELLKGVFGRLLMKEGVQVVLARSGAQEEFASRWAAIPRFNELKIFKDGIDGLSLITGQEYKHMLRVSVVSFRGACGNNH